VTISIFNIDNMDMGADSESDWSDSDEESVESDWSEYNIESEAPIASPSPN